VFQSDFQAEREAREKQASELDRTKEELKNIRKEKERMQEDELRNNNRNLENIKNRHAQGNPIVSGYIANNPGNRHGNAHQVKYQNVAGHNPHHIYGGMQGDHLFGSRNAASEVALRPCPKCNKSFPDIETLQIHLMDCIDD